MDAYCMRTLKCTEVARTTHLSLVGGKYRVEDPRSFHKIYAKHHAHGKGAYLVEKVVYPSKWYLDVDHVDSRRLNAMIGKFPHIAKSNCRSGRSHNKRPAASPSAMHSFLLQSHKTISIKPVEIVLTHHQLT